MSASDSGRQSGRLVVQKSLAGSIVFAEGSVTQLRVVSDKGDDIVTGLRPIETLDIPLLDRSIPKGSYTVTAVERPCQGNCDVLGPPVQSTRCQLEVDVNPDRATRVAIVLTPASGGARSECSATTAR